MTKEDDQALDRPQRRLLCRLFNGRTVPVIADGMPFLTYKEARKHLESLPPEQREAVYLEMKSQLR